MSRRLALPLAVALALSACGAEEEGSATMRPGEDCLSCHTGGEHGFTLAGTVYGAAAGGAGLAGATVVVTDAASRVVTMTSNAAGNFYTAAPVAFPVSLELRVGGVARGTMGGLAQGACNACHGGGRRIYPQ